MPLLYSAMLGRPFRADALDSRRLRDSAIAAFIASSNRLLRPHFAAERMVGVDFCCRPSWRQLVRVSDPPPPNAAIEREGSIGLVRRRAAPSRSLLCSSFVASFKTETFIQWKMT